MRDIATIGSATRDIFFEGDYQLAKWAAAPSGKAYVLPFGEKLGVRAAHATIGGNAANAAVTFARQGFRAACAAKIGSDLSGRELTERLRKENVRTDDIAVSRAVPTALSVLLLEKGERTILGYHGASDTFALKDLRLPKLSARWWYVSLAGESARMYPRLVAYARKQRIKIAFNPSGYHIERYRSDILRSLQYVDVLVLNQGEAASLVGIPFSNERAVFKKIDALLSPGIVAVTNGKKGAIVSDGSRIYRAGIFPEKRLADRTGAGDAFGSGFVAGLMRGANIFHPSAIQYALRFASANATSVVERIGATEGILSKREFEKQGRWRRFPVRVTPVR